MLNMTTRKEWVEITPKNTSAIPYPRTGHSTLLTYLPAGSPNAKPYMLVYGGKNEKEVSDSVWLFDLHEHTWHMQNCSANSTFGVPVPRYGHTAQILERFPGRPVMVVFGGWNDPTQPFIHYKTTWGLDLISWVWVPYSTTQLPKERGFAASTLLSPSRFVMTGGAGLFTDVWVGGFNASGWYIWEELISANEYPADGASAALLTLPTNSDGPIITVIGGSDNTDTQHMSTRTLTLGCNAGHQTRNFSMQFCEPCAKGTFSLGAGNVCTDCPGDASTTVTGAVNVTQCVVCIKGTCNDDGTSACSLDSAYVGKCTCKFGYSGDRCDTNWLFITVAAGAGLLVVAVLGLVMWRMSRSRKFKYQLLENRLAQTEQEVEELSRWEISPSDIEALERIDLGYEGAFGEVWLAKWGDRNVALKKLKATVRDLPGIIGEFQREVRFLACLRHPNIVFFYGAGTWAGTPFLLTEYMSSGSLRKILDDPTVEVSYSKMLNFALDTARGLQFLHSLKPLRIHRDIKASNLLVTESGKIKGLRYMDPQINS